MKATLKVPRLSMNMQDATVTQWFKSEGDTFKAGEPLYMIETEKVATEIEAPSNGTLLEILIAGGTDCMVGDPVCRIETT